MKEDTARELFRAIHEGLWCSIVYSNKAGKTTRYWIAIDDIHMSSFTLSVSGMQLMTHLVQKMEIHIEGILSAEAIDGTWYPVNAQLTDDILRNPDKYARLFGSSVNRRILDYLSAANRLDSTPYKTSFTLLDHIDDEVLYSDSIPLSGSQMDVLLNTFEANVRNDKRRIQLKKKQLGMNLLSLHTHKGLYVLAWLCLRLDVMHGTLRAEEEPQIAYEFAIDGEKCSAASFLNPEDMGLLNNFRENGEAIRNAILANHPDVQIDDLPYVLEIGRDTLLNLNYEYDGIMKMAEDKEGLSEPLKAFFGQLTAHPRAHRPCPAALMNDQVNLDQLTAVNHAMRYPVSYIQGPPGTGKTATILNVLLTSFFNNRTVLFVSYNNHPIDEVCRKLSSLSYQGKRILFPAVRLGNFANVSSTLKQLRSLMKTAARAKCSDMDLKQAKKKISAGAAALNRYLDQYEKLTELKNRKEAMEKLLAGSTQMNFQLDLETGQLPALNKEIRKLGFFSTKEALECLQYDHDLLFSCLYEMSLRSLKLIFQPKYAELRDIIEIKDEEKAVRSFNSYLRSQENLRNFLKIFPIVITTCLSSFRLGEPDPVFDMTIMDEASQCNTAAALVPIVRGRNLMLVGDPQQLQPVILLNPLINKRLKERYQISDTYDYIHNSVYKTFLKADPVSDEVLLSHHYRCDPAIISFNNEKYYNGRLHMNGKRSNVHPLVALNIENDHSNERNAAPLEADAAVQYIESHPDKSVGIITPFVNQRQVITEKLKDNHLNQVACGTVHAFQGDEKDIILFSLGITDKTSEKTYQWLSTNRELINVAVSRAREQLVLIGSHKDILRLHKSGDQDDLYELVRYVESNGKTKVTRLPAASRALGLRPYSTETEAAFLTTLNHALDTAFQDGSRYKVHKEVPISQVFINNPSYNSLFYNGRFDFVVYHLEGAVEVPVLAIELDGMEHVNKEIVRERDQKKEEICEEHGFHLIRVPNTYARRYHYIKDILIRYFKQR